MSSFFSERTAEYSLVPNLMGELQKEFDYVAPIFFWKSREGNSVSKATLKNRQVKILPFFARRPKKTKNERFTIGKINHQLFTFANNAKKNGLPTFIGYIASQNIFENYNCRNHYWFNITNSNCKDEATFSFDLLHSRIKWLDQVDSKIEIINPRDIAQIMKSLTTYYSWNEALELMGELNKSMYTHNYFNYRFFGGGYKPVYFLMLE